MYLKKVLKAIRENDSFLITAHCDPEGDSLGSQLAIAQMLRQLDKRYIIINPDLPPPMYDFLKDIKQIILPSGAAAYDFDVALVLDCPIIERIGSVKELIRGKAIVNIDHHVSNANFGSINYVDPKASSTGEIIYNLVEGLGCRLNKNLAVYLYLAILTDTGGFRYSNTTPRTMRMAAELLDVGIRPKDIYDRIYESHSLASRRLLALSLKTIKVSKDGKIAIMYLTKVMFDKTKATMHDAEAFINYPRFIEGVDIALLFNDNVDKGFTKVSFRSNGDWVNVNKIASKFGGGGHVSASGCLVKGDIKTVEEKILKEVKKVTSSEG